MDKRFRYREKHVHDVVVAGSVIRVWNAAGAIDRRLIAQAFTQLLKTSFVYPYIALMPDYHPGQNVMVGSVIPTKDVILPSVVGGDIGCGMAAVRLPIESEQLSPELGMIRERISAAIPVGTAHNSTVTKRVEENSLWRRELRAPLLSNRVRNKLMRQFGSLGGGNHFLEVGEDTEHHIWLIVHSGSRGLGVLLRDYYIEHGALESGLDQRTYAKFPYLIANTQLAVDYLTDLSFALDFARENRREMMLRVLEVFAKLFEAVQTQGEANLVNLSIDLSHNFVAVEEHFNERLYVHRKGATRATKGLSGVIPGSMGSESFITEGRGNEYSFCSCSHGAGRAMSRAEAFRHISDRDFRKSMTSVVYRHDDRLKDESPLAYKNVRQVMRGQRDLVKILYELRPLMSIKGVDRSSTREQEEGEDDA